MRFMHISDVHLGVEPDTGKSWSKKRAQDIWTSFADVIEQAAIEQPDFLFISGDLFHGQPLKKELKEVNYLFEKIPDTKVLLMAGNHDYIQPKSYYRTFEWAKNVCFFPQEEVTVFDFPEQNVAVYGMSYWHREISERKYDRLIPRNPNRINVLLAHGGDEKHIPFSVPQILQNGFDYIAAGHIHKSSQLEPGRAVMAGALEPTDCNDTGTHGYWCGELEKSDTAHGAELHFYPIKKCEYCHEVLEVTAETTERQLQEKIKTLLAERPEYQYFRIYLEGYADPDNVFDLGQFTSWNRIVDVTSRLVPDYHYDKMLLENKDSILGKYIHTMQSRPKSAVTEKALEYGVNALLGHQICR